MIFGNDQILTRFDSEGTMEWKIMAVCLFCRCADELLLIYIFDDSAGEEYLMSKIRNF